MTRWIYAGCCLLSASLAFGATADPSSASAQAREPLLLALAGDSDCAYRLARRSGEAELPSVDWDGTADEDKPAARSGLAPDHDCTSRRATGASGSPELRAGGRRAGPSDKPQSTPASQPEKIWAEPLGYHKLSTRLSAPEVRTPSIEVDFAINNVKDRVGADAAVCDPHSPTLCDRSRFYFPQLRVDPEKKQILYNDEVVAAYEVKWLTVRITPSGRYILKAEIQQGIEDNGFDKYPVSYIAVYLEKIENPFYPRP